MRRRKWCVWLVLVLFLTLLVTACGGRTSGPTDPSQSGAKDAADAQSGAKRLVIAQGTDAVTLDAHRITDSPTASIAEHIYEPLFTLKDGEIVPLLAESATMSADGLSWTIQLRPGVKFHDGTDLTAEVVKYNFERILNPDNKIPFRFLISPVTDLQVLDALRLKVTTGDQPFAPMLSHLTHSSTAIMSKAALEQHGDAVTDHPAGTGPFTLKEWRKDEQITLTRNPKYWGDAPKLDEVVFRAVKEDGARVLMAESGEADVAVRVPPEEVARLQSLPRVDVVETPSVRTIYIYFNVTKAPFDNPLVRQAINYAIDKEAIARGVQQGTVRPSDAPISPGIFGYAPQEPYAYDKAKARQLLADAGYPDGFKTTLYHPTGRYPQDARVAEAVRAQLRDVGIDVTLQTMEWANFLSFTGKPREENETTMALLGWGTVTGDADYGLFPLFHTSEHVPTGSNRSFYSNSTVDGLLDQGRSTADTRVREAVYRQAVHHIWRDAPWIFLYSETQLTAVNKRVQGLNIHVTERLLAHQADVK